MSTTLHLNPVAKLREIGAELTALLAKSETDQSSEHLDALAKATERYEAAKAAAEVYQKAADAARDASSVSPSAGLHVLQSPDGKGIAVADEDAPRFEQLTEIREPRYKRAFRAFLRGIDRMDKADLDVLQDANRRAKAMQIGLDTAGGFLVPPDLADEIVKRDSHPTDVVSRVARLTTSRDRLTIPIHRGGDDIYATGLRYVFAGETGTTPEDTSLENWGEITIDVHEATMDVRMSRSMVEDSAFDIQQWVIGEAQDADRLERERYIVSTAGTGVSRPRGILASVGTGQDLYATTNVGNPITANGIIALQAALPVQYRDVNRAVWVINGGDVYARIANLRENDTANTGQFVGFVSGLNDAGMAGARQLRMLGHQVLLSAFMPAAGAGNNVILFGDLAKAYAMVERVGMVAMPYGDQDATSLRTNTVGIVFRTRFGGAPRQARALRVGVQS